MEKKSSKFKKFLITASIPVALAAGTHIGLKAHVNKMNADIAARNAGRSALVAKEFPISLSYAKIFSGKFSDVINNPNKPGNCSGYTLRAAALFGKKFVYADAWNMGVKNKVVAKAAFDRQKNSGGIPKKQLQEMIADGKINPGIVIGVFYPPSITNQPERPFTHMMVYAGKGVFWHNFSGPKEISLDEIFSAKSKKGERIFYPVVVIEPKQ